MANGKDKQGREYAKVANVKAGDLIQVDGDFGCIKPWSVLQVQKGLYITCEDGLHDLASQIEDDFYVGIYPIELPNV